MNLIYILDDDVMVNCLVRVVNYYDKVMFKMKRGGLDVIELVYKIIVKNYKCVFRVLMDEWRLE